MARDRSLRRLGRCYASLLRVYPKSYRDRFAAPMEQAFNDLLREHTAKEKSIMRVALWMFCETFTGAMRENMATITLRPKTLLRIALLTATILLIPLLATQYSEGFAWDLADFVLAGLLLVGAGILFAVLTGQGSSISYRAAVAIAIAAALLLVWVSLAVGIVGNAENPANLPYLGVPAVGVVGAMRARLQPAGMARALLATALAQALVALIVLVAASNPFIAFELAINGFFVLLFLGSALLFRHTARQGN